MKIMSLTYLHLIYLINVSLWIKSNNNCWASDSVHIHIGTAEPMLIQNEGVRLHY